MPSNVYLYSYGGISCCVFESIYLKFEKRNQIHDGNVLCKCYYYGDSSVSHLQIALGWKIVYR